VENTAEGFVQRWYANTENALELNWLPVKEIIEFDIAKLAFEAIYFDNWPSYMPVNVKQQVREYYVAIAMARN
jgi:hypothetical protein